MEKRADPKHTRLCAFCKNWYDPTNSAIELQAHLLVGKLKIQCRKMSVLQKIIWKLQQGLVVQSMNVSYTRIKAVFILNTAFIFLLYKTSVK